MHVNKNKDTWLLLLHSPKKGLLMVADRLLSTEFLRRVFSWIVSSPFSLIKEGTEKLAYFY